MTDTLAYRIDADALALDAERLDAERHAAAAVENAYMFTDSAVMADAVAHAAAEWPMYGERPVSGDTLARSVRARQGTARATGHPVPHRHATALASMALWGSDEPMSSAADWTAPLPSTERGRPFRRRARHQ